MLTDREQEVYRYLLRGLSYIDIGRELDIQQPTVVKHVMNVYMKKMVGTRAELMAQRIEELENEIKNMKCTSSSTRV